MRFGDPPGNGETEAGTTLGTCTLCFDAVEAFEDMALIFSRDAGTVVGDGDLGFAGLGGTSDTDFAAGGCILESVIDEDDKQLSEACGVAVYLHGCSYIGVQAYAKQIGECAHIADNLFNEGGEAELLEQEVGTAFVGAGERGEVTYEDGEVVKFLGNSFGLFKVGFNATFGVAEEEGVIRPGNRYRCTELVGSIRNELAL